MAKKRRTTRNPKTSPKPASTRATGAKARGSVSSGMSARDYESTRALFWENVVREMLSGLSVLSQQHPELFDGRFAVLTNGGERIPIAGIEPVFACSMAAVGRERELSQAVQATIFRIRTPAGEVFTLPVHEIRAMHALTPELLSKIQAAVGEEGASGSGEEPKPFGLAAFSALPKSPRLPAPAHPTE